MKRVRKPLPDGPLAAAPLGSAARRGRDTPPGARARSARWRQRAPCSDDLWPGATPRDAGGLLQGRHDRRCSRECQCPGGPWSPRPSGRLPEPPVRAAHAVSIRGVFEDARPRLRACYQRGLAAAPDQRGSLAIDLSLSASGAPFTVAIARSTLADEAGDTCAVGVVRGLRFAPPHNGFLALTYPIDL